MLRPMPRLLRTSMAILLFAVGLISVGLSSAPTANAETEDSVRNLDASYDVRKDGSVDVSYKLDWDFGDTGAHGIKLSIVTAEQWENDPLQEAVYKISNLKASSPTGVPTDVESHENKSAGTLEVQIGDPKTELDVDRASYVVTYTLDGAMRTFDKRPQFYWDVTSSDFPAVENFTITVTGPSDVPRARCLIGSDECTAKVSGDRAVLTGKSVDPGSTLTAVAEFESGSVANAKPNLRERELYQPALLAMDSSVTVGTDGVATVRERLKVRTTPRNSEVSWEIPQRRGLSWSRDQLYEISDVSVTDRDGKSLPVTHETESEGEPRQRDEIEAELPDDAADAGTVELVARYTVRGAVVSTGTGPASFIWPISTFSSREYDIVPTERVSWKLPADVSRLDCRYQNDLDDTDGHCYIDDQLSSDGRTATYRLADDDGSGPGEWAVIEFDAGSVGTLAAVTERSAAFRTAVTAALLIGSIVIFPVLGLLLSRVRLGNARDQRYVGVPPGTMGSNTSVTTARLNGTVPVRFTPPEGSFVQVGLALDRKVEPRQLAATLVNMAVNGAIRLQSKPLAIWEQDRAALTSSWEHALYDRAKPADSDGELSTSDRTKLARQLEGQRKQAAKQGDLLHRIPLKGPTTVLWALPAAFAVVAGTIATVATGQIGWLPVGIGVAVLVSAGTAVGVLRQPRLRTAKATALAEQAIGFREYLRTAESVELNVDAEADIYRRYLPWAVLFDEVDRWTKVCQQLAAADRIAAPDTSFMVGLGSIDQLGRDLRGFTNSVSSSPSSGGGGSGGSSGFSGGASGGGGGGGTSASSW